mmetsp:Transcript_14123/g.20692  ORF Transcript_14123/g.20692 Transcript_14123/m.20692 type:complete len:386 (-) Transcript_14123:95-1252(-)|eukprot:CAMPEP_0194049314 /NCGR_PEP_ID=MMETSP0009_2-20130614/30332_1 /TAXON_ID=210454 /ORGANISM="Grammatophora oceanica, Strain CCMP 410" /LENGTH=385 /DNA_ID=CAMNT_0038695439 /DNA_START=80 /DNA_END=1237 /DNA_ORIENTATION=+
MSDDDVVIVCALRTPMCRARKGGLAKTPATTLLSTVLQATVQQTGIPPADIEDVCVGNVLAPPSGAAAWRMAQLVAGFPDTTALSAVNRQCSSGLQAVANIAHAIKSKSIKIGIGAGVESMSQNPMNKIEPPDVDWNQMQSCSAAMDCLTPMGVTSENVVKDYGLQRAKLDQFALESHRKAAAAQHQGKFSAEIVPVNGVDKDDGIRPGTTYQVLSKLRPVFDKERGVTTAGNSSQTTDGAAAVVLMTRAEARCRRLRVMGVWRGFAVKGVPPRVMGIGPAFAIPEVLKQCGLQIGDVDLFEINEAFASQATWCVEELGIEKRKVNPNGGAIALGHPLGCTGARQVATLLNEMHRENHRYGVISMCIGTGMGAAAVIEVEPRASL